MNIIHKSIYIINYETQQVILGSLRQPLIPMLLS